MDESILSRMDPRLRGYFNAAFSPFQKGFFDGFDNLFHRDVYPFNITSRKIQNFP
jgi:hypothetical protein